MKDEPLGRGAHKAKPAKLSEHGRSVVKQMLRRAKGRWGAGWELLSQDQREAYVGLKVASLLLGQCEDVAPPGSPMARLQEIARAGVPEDRPLTQMRRNVNPPCARTGDSDCGDTDCERRRAEPTATAS